MTFKSICQNQINMDLSPLNRFGTPTAAEPGQRPDHPEGVPRRQRGGGVPMRHVRQILHQPPPPLIPHGKEHLPKMLIDHACMTTRPLGKSQI